MDTPQIGNQGNIEFHWERFERSGPSVKYRDGRFMSNLDFYIGSRSAEFMAKVFWSVGIGNDTRSDSYVSH